MPAKQTYNPLDKHVDEFWTYREVQDQWRDLLDQQDKVQIHNWPQSVERSTTKWAAWLPDGWAQGTAKQQSQYSGTKTVYVSPEGKVFWGKDMVQKKLGPLHDRPERVESEAAIRWPDWLPKDWALSFKRSSTGIYRIFVRPSGDRYFKTKEAVLKDVATMCCRPFGEPIVLEASVLARLANSQIENKQASPAKRPCLDEPGSSNDDSGCQLVKQDDKWTAWPEDVELVDLESFSPFLVKAGLEISSRETLCYKFVGEVPMTLFAEQGKLEIETNDWSLACRIAKLYTSSLNEA